MMFSRLIGPFLLALAGLLATPLTWAAEDQVAVPKLTAAIIDSTRTLSPQDLGSIDAQLRAFAQRKGSQVAVLMISSTKPETIEQYSLRVAEAWKIGRAKVDDGVIVVVAKDDRTLRIEVGYGLEGAIPDAMAKRIISENIAPRFRAGDFAAGIRDGTAMLMKLIDGEKLAPPSFAAPHEDPPGLFDLLVPLFFAVAIGSVLMQIFGRVPGAGMAGIGFGVSAWWIMGSASVALIAIIVGFLLSLMAGSQKLAQLQHGRGGGWGGGGWGGGSSSGGGFGGGGGSFGGGGASGNW